MSYKKSFIYIIFSGLFLAFVWIIGYWSLSGIETNASYYTNERLKIHHDIIGENNREEAKLLIIGGSSVLFGVNNKEISNELNIPVYNMGSSAQLGLDYLLYDAKKEIDNNDIVLLQLEYSLYDKAYDCSIQKISIIWDSDDRDYLRTLSLTDRIILIYGISPELIFEKLKTVLLGRKNINQGIEDAKWIDEYGMIQSNTIENSNKNELLKMEKKIVFNNDVVLDEYKKENIKEFLSYCRSKNVKVYVTFPPYLYDKRYFNKKDEREIQKIKDFWESNNVKVINNYTDTLYNVDDFYNTVFHLNTDGREKHTKMLIEKLKPYINNN